MDRRTGQSTVAMQSPHKTITNRIDTLADTPLDVSHSIHAHPKLAIHEFHACELPTRTG